MKKRILAGILLALLLFCADCGSSEPIDPDLDLDLSRMSSTMIYSTISQMLENPKPYLGKVIKVAGYYSYDIMNRHEREKKKVHKHLPSPCSPILLASLISLFP